MKSFVAIFLFALMVGLRADDFEELLLADDAESDVPDRHPSVQCSIDLYDCFKAGTLSKKECMLKYKSCMAVLIPTLPPMVTTCNNKLYDCIKAGKGKLECMKEFSSCMSVLLPTLPPFVTTCNNNLKQCLQEQSFLAGKAQCFVDYGKCLINKGPVTEALMDVSYDGEPDRHPYVQCKIDLYDCIKAGVKGKLECMKEYKDCMAVLIPTVPPFVITCKNNLRQCLNDSKGWKEKAQCFLDFGKCLKNKGPAEVALDAIEDMGQVQDESGYVQCMKDLYQCYKDKKDIKTCTAEYKTCVEALIPDYVKQCYAKGKECYASATNIKEKYECGKELAVCLKNGATS